MHIVVTGANGFVGRALRRRLGQAPTTRLTLMDMRFDRAPAGSSDSREQRITASIADRAAIERVFEAPVDVVFHLASVPGGLAERDYERARDVNIGGTTLLLEAGKSQVERGGRPPVFVFASTIGVFGSPLPALVDDTTPAHPGMTYGAQKLVGEILVAEFTRRGWVDGRSLRLPGVLARPPEETGQMSAFISQMIHELAAGRRFTCPVGPQATTWASSVGNVVDNLMHAARIDGARLGPGRCVTLPTWRFSFEAFANAIAAVHGTGVEALVSWQPDARIEALFGRMPPLRTSVADAAGFRRDDDLAALVRRAVEFD